jgi:predicted nucleic acid-binding protein
VPAIFDIEVTAALVRRGVPAASVDRFLVAHLARRKLVTLGPRAASAARRIVRITQLRAADALYVWVAAHHALTLVTAHEEVLARARLAGVTATLP